MAFYLSPDVNSDICGIPSGPDIPNITDLNTLRDALFKAVQYLAEIGHFTSDDVWTRNITGKVLQPFLSDAQRKGIIDEFLVDMLPTVADMNFLIRVIMRKDRDHYRMAMVARNEVTDFQFDHTPIGNSFPEEATQAV